MTDDSSQPVTRHGQWRSTLAFILVTTGAAVGLGNIWIFPHLAGTHGGSAFVIVYLACVLLIGFPALMAEVLIGRLGRKNPVDTLKDLSLKHHKTPLWGILGWMGALALLLILSFYSVVAGWAVAYFIMAMKGSFHQATPADIQGIWDSLMSSPLRLLLWHSTFMIMTLTVVARGVEKGIETLSKILMPALFLILIVLVFYALYEGNVKAALSFLFEFRIENVTAASVISALGASFFTLALGAGCMLVYGAYLPSSVPIGKTLAIVVGLDTLVSMLAGLAIFPIVFQYNLPPDSGYGLMYQILPITFGALPGGQWVATLFFLLLVFAAWTSTLSLAEPLVMLMVEKCQIHRLKASIYVGLTAWILGIGGLLSFNLWKDVHIIKDWDFFTTLTNIPLNFLLPLGGLGFVIFGGWVLDRHTSEKGLHLKYPIMYQLWYFLIRFIVPIGITVIFIANFI